MAARSHHRLNGIPVLTMLVADVDMSLVLHPLWMIGPSPQMQRATLDVGDVAVVVAVEADPAAVLSEACSNGQHWTEMKTKPGWAASENQFATPPSSQR